MYISKDIRSIVILRALQLGDLLCSVPAFRALRKAYPNAHIAVLGLPWMKSFVERFSMYLDEYIWFPGYPGLPEQKVDHRATASFITEMIERKFDVALQMQGNGSIVNPLVALFGASFNGGFYRKEDDVPEGFFIEYPEGIHEIRRHLALIRHLGVAIEGEHLEFPLTQKDEEDLAAASLQLERSTYICIHPGSRGAWRQWPPEYFAKIADQCANRGWQIVLTGTADEIPVVERVADHMKFEPIIAAGKTSLGAIAVLLKNAGGLVSNCTGVAHIAAALKTKSVVISMDGEPERWGSLNKYLHTTIDWTRIPDFDFVRQAVDERFSAISKPTV